LPAAQEEAFLTTQASTITIGRYRFEGPYPSTAYLADRAGVYAILALRGGTYYVIDIGESATVKSRVETHDRKICWQRNAGQGVLYVAVLYTPGLAQVGRVQIEQELRMQYNPPCGTR
jgi:hypothetical protein